MNAVIMSTHMYVYLPAAEKYTSPLCNIAELEKNHRKSESPHAMIRENRQLVTNEPVEFEK